MNLVPCGWYNPGDKLTITVILSNSDISTAVRREACLVLKVEIANDLDVQNETPLHHCSNPYKWFFSYVFGEPTSEEARSKA
jgi:hypothetical protein